MRGGLEKGGRSSWGGIGGQWVDWWDYSPSLRADKPPMAGGEHLSLQAASELRPWELRLGPSQSNLKSPSKFPRLFELNFVAEIE
jgi:hypothetical protein